MLLADAATTINLGDGINFVASGGLASLLFYLYRQERIAREAAENRERATLERIVTFGQEAFPLLADARKDAEDASRARVGARAELADSLDEVKGMLKDLRGKGS